MIELKRACFSSRLARGFLAAVSAAGVTIACTAANEKSEVPDSGKTPAAAVRMNAGMIGPPGLDNAAATIAYFNNGISFAGPDTSYTEELDCNSTNDCAGNAKLSLTIEPEDNSHRVDWIDAFGNTERRGYVVARIINNSGKPFRRLGLDGKDTTYLWVGPVQADGRKRRVAWVNVSLLTGEAGQFKRPQPKFRNCRLDGWQTRAEPAAGLRADHIGNHCPEISSMALTTNEIAGEDTSLPFYPPEMWNSCSGGCCQIDY